MIQKVILRRLLPGLYVLPCFAFLLGLARYSYRAKELLACWIFFCSLFALLAVLFLGSLLACYAVRHLLNWMSVAKTVISELVECLADVPQEAIPSPRNLAAGTLKLLSTGTYATADALDSDAFLSIEVAPSAVNDHNV